MRSALRVALLALVAPWTSGLRLAAHRPGTSGIRLAARSPGTRGVRLRSSAVPAAAVSMSAATDWLLENGYTVEDAKGSGSSGWASFSQLSARRPDGSDVKLFVKTAGRSAKEMFEGEALGLQAMHATKTIRVPAVEHYGDAPSGGSFMIMEYLDLRGSADPTELGRQMARMHLAPPLAPEARDEGKFGFPVDNTIGGTPQKNPWTSDWVEFFREHRIGYQVGLAGSSELTREWDAALKRTDGLRSLFAGAGEIKPSTLHGDLWSGNMAASAMSEPVIFDPATYYGHHEAEWGMSWCASLGPAFWRGYRELIPEDEGFGERRALYELYHKLNHYNLFGGGYMSDSMRLCKQLGR